MIATDDLLLGGGALVGGLGLLGLSLYKQNQAGKRATAAFACAMDHASKAEMAAKSLNKLRRISGNDVNIGVMNKDIQDQGMSDNAFYIASKDYKSFAKKLMARKLRGSGGTVAVGDKARVLPIVAHELGHASNQRTGRAKWRTIGTLAGAGIGLASVTGRLLYNNYRHPSLSDALVVSSLTSLGLAAGNAIASHSVYTEEAEATDNAMDYLKKMKRSSKQLELDKDTLDAALNTYKTSRDWGIARDLGASLAITGGLYLANKVL